MKNLTKLFCLGLTLLALPALISAQDIDVDNKTNCDYLVKVNLTNSTTGCPMGSGPLVLCPAGTKTTILAGTPATTLVVAYGCELAGSGIPPIVVARPGCGPGVVTRPWCVSSTFVYKNKLLEIN